MPSIDGLMTGLDTTSLIEGLVSIQNQRISELDSAKQAIYEEQAAFSGIEANLLSLKGALNRLSTIRRGPFADRMLDTSDERLVTGAASAGAAEGVYSITVQQLAKSHQIASQGYADPGSEISQGTFTVIVGGDSVAVTIDGTNNSLQGLAESINGSEAGVSAAIINDGTGTSPYRLLLTSNETGAAQSIGISNALDGGSGVKPDFTGPALQDAADAILLLGSGAGALTIQNSTNTVEDLIPGVTLNLESADPATAVQINVARDVESARSAIESFVEAFNNLMTFVDQQVDYDAESDKASPLLGNRSATAIQDRVRNAALATVSGLRSEVNRLSAIGIAVTDRGHLTIDGPQLDNVLSGVSSEISLEDLGRLFGFSGSSDNPGIEFLLAGSKTIATAQPFQVDITSAAENASIVAGTAMGATTTIDSSNNTFALRVDGVDSGTLVLNSGTYTPDQLASEVRRVIENANSLAHQAVGVSVEADMLRITSGRYGRDSEVGGLSGSALSDLGFVGTELDQGQDVVGKFLVDGAEELATGTGRVLVGDAGNATTAGLQLLVNLTENQVQTGSDAAMTLTEGVASRLDRVMKELLDPVEGTIVNASDAYDQRIETIDETIARYTELVEQRRERLLRDFAALESTVSELQFAGNYLSANLSSASGFLSGALG